MVEEQLVCEMCGNTLKRSIGSMVIDTRLKEREQIVVEDLKFISCTVCSFKKIAPGYENIPKTLVHYYSSVNKKKLDDVLKKGKISYKDISSVTEQEKKSSASSLVGRFVEWIKK